jgi:hypothetical protein
MRTFILSLTLLFSALLPLPARAENITIKQGSVSISVPVPDGFKLAGESTPAFQAVAGHMNQMGNSLLALFFQPGANGDMNLNRQADIQGVKSISQRDATKSELDQVRLQVDQQRDKLLKEAAAKANLKGIVFDPVHDFSDRHFSYLAHLPDENGAMGSTVCTTALIRGRLWLIYMRNADGDTKADQELLKSQSKSWFSSILAASPSDALTLAREEQSGGGEGGVIGKYTLIGSIAGGLGAFIAGIMKKKKKPGASP